MNKKRFDAIVFTVGINALVLNFRKKEASFTWRSFFLY